MTLTTRKTPAYGMWEATGTRDDGGLVQALGLTPERAEAFARVRAETWLQCGGCGKVACRPMEARISRRAYHGAVLCASCRSSSDGEEGGA